jgi:ribonuclease Z
MAQLKIPLGKLDVVFLTHYHSNHTAGVPDIWLTGWLAPPYAQTRWPSI